MEETIELREIIEIILKGKWLIAIITIVCMLIAVVVSWFILPAKYESKAVVQIASNDQDTGIIANYVATEFTPQIFSERATNGPILKEAFEREQIQNNFYIKNLTVSNVANTNLVSLTYSSTSPENAQKELETIITVTINEMNESVHATLQNLETIYNAEANSLATEIESIIDEYNQLIRQNNLPELLILQTILNTEILLNISEDQTETLSNVSGALQNELLQLQTQIQTKSQEYRNVLSKHQSVKTGLDSFKPDPFIRIIKNPSLIENPSSPNKTLNLAIGFVLGLMIGIGIVFFRYYWKNSTPAK